MLRMILAAALLSAVALAASGAEPVAEVTTSTGQTFKYATVIRVTGHKVLLSYQNADGGIATASVALDSLTDDARTSLGLRTRKDQKEFDAWQAAKAEEQKANAVLNYGGVPRDQEWVDMQYEKFASRLGFSDDKLYDLKFAQEVTDDPHQTGAEVRYIIKLGAVNPVFPPRAYEPWSGKTSRVFQVTGPADMLVEITRKDGSQWYIYLEGYDTAKLVDGVPFGDVFVRYAGTHTYNTAMGSIFTVTKYVPLRPPTKADFVAALKAGSVLPER